MAIPAAQIWAIDSAAAASNANAGGFDPSNAGMLTDLAADTNTGNTASPIVSSASYNFVAGDVGHWVYVKSGTNWTPGFYQIASVATNKATLTASIGNAEQLNIQGSFYGPNTVAGCATVGTPTAGTFTIDYSRSASSPVTATDFNAVGASLTLTSLTAAFTPVMVGNTFFQSTTGTGAFGVIGRYSIATYVNATTVMLDRTPNSGTASVNTSGKIGGALSLGSSDDAIFETSTAGNLWYVKGSATYTLGGGVSISSGAAGTALLPVNLIGFASKRGDNPVGSTRPIFACGANAFQCATYWQLMNIQMTGTGVGVFQNGAVLVNRLTNVKAVNSSTTTARSAYSTINSAVTLIGCEGVSYRGMALQSATTVAIACWFHDSNQGISQAAAGNIFITDTIISGCVASAINLATAGNVNQVIVNNTLVGTTSQRGVGIQFVSGAAPYTILNNIITGFATGISGGTYSTAAAENYNNFFNNGTDVSNWNKGQNDFAIDPAFVSVIERTGVTATTTAGNHLVQSGATFQTWGVTAGVDYIYIASGTGVTAGVYGITSVDSETQITTDITLTANATADKVWFILQGTNFATGSALNNIGYPGTFPGSVATSYMGLGAVQNQVTSGGGGTPSWAA